jgi:hypothetical protein
MTLASTRDSIRGLEDGAGVATLPHLVVTVVAKVDTVARPLMATTMDSTAVAVVGVHMAEAGRMVEDVSMVVAEDVGLAQRRSAPIPAG